MTSRMSASERRERLVDAAFSLLARHGLDALTTRAICNEAKMSQSVFHYCFHSKQDLLRELITVTVGGLVGSAQEVPVPAGSSGSSADLHAVLAATFEALWEEARAHPDRQLALYELTTAALRDPDLANLAALQYRTSFDAMERGLEAIETACRSSWAVPRPVMARMAISFFDGLVLGWLSDRDDDAAQRTLAAGTAAIFSLGAPSSGNHVDPDPP